MSQILKHNLIILICSCFIDFLGGLSLNHLITYRLANFGIFGSNLDTMGLETYPRTYSGHF